VIPLIPFPRAQLHVLQLSLHHLLLLRPVVCPHQHHVHLRTIRSHKNACAGAATANAPATAAITTRAFIVRAIESLLFSLTFRRTFQGLSCTRTSATRRKSYKPNSRFSDFLSLSNVAQFSFAAVLPFIFSSTAFVAAPALPLLLHSPQNNSKQFIDVAPLPAECLASRLPGCPFKYVPRSKKRLFAIGP